jgi:hypothetical protein
MPCPSLLQLNQSLSRLAQHGMALVELLTSSNRPCPEIVPRFARLARAIRWAIALAAVLRGEYHLPPARKHTEPTQDREPHPRRPATPRAPREVDSAMHHAFRTLTISQIAAKLCLELGIATDDPDYPAELLSLDMTAAEFAQSQARPGALPLDPARDRGPWTPLPEKNTRLTAGHQPQPAPHPRQ